MGGIVLSERMTDWLLLVAAIVSSMIIFAALERIARSLIYPLAIIAIALIVAKVAFGLSPQYLWYESVNTIQKLSSKFS